MKRAMSTFGVPTLQPRRWITVAPKTWNSCATPSPSRRCTGFEWIPSRLMTGLERVARYNWKFDVNVDESHYPTLANVGDMRAR